ncbi:MAG TPA: hypothetical protein VHE54_19455 [Puia sp.]|nr:hypothetical protein [Puia sp.]
MRVSVLLVIAGVLFASAARGQTRWKYRSDNTVGVVAGELGNFGQVQTVNGVYKGPWFFGLGTGLDYYRFRTVPLYLSVTRDLFGASEKSGFFVDLGGGITLPWFSGYPLPDGIVSRSFSAGFWGNGGLGYRHALSDHSKTAFLFTISYGIKRVTERQTSQPVCFACMPPEPQTTQSNDYTYLNRVLLFGIGFQF